MIQSETKNCQNCKNQFTIEPDDFAFYEKMKVPPPTFCPECRLKRRLAWRNEHNLYRRKDDRTGQEIFAGFPSKAPIKVWEKEYWVSDEWDPLDYGKDYDFSKDFFTQIKDLIYHVPWPSRSILNTVNSDYIDQAGNIKNCYLCFSIDHSEDSSYVVRALKIRNSLDLTQSTDCELCYEGISLSGCYRTFFSEDCENCVDVWFSKNLVGCNNCFGSTNLRNAQYYFFNEKLSKEEYDNKIKKLNLNSYQSFIKVYENAKKHTLNFPVKYFHGLRAIDSNGEYLHNTKNVKQSFFIENGQDIKYCQNVYAGSKDSYDHTVWGNDSTLIYESLTCGEQINNLKFCFDCWPSCQDLEYCISCRSSSNLFGCFGLKKKQYCIFNKQYSKEEYFILREKIMNHMNEMPYKNTKGQVYRYGEFFPEEFSPFAYNETQLIDIWPINKEGALLQGYTWREPEVKEYQTTLLTSNVPDSINETSETIIKELIQCELCKKAYKIVKTEFDFLKKYNIPLPRYCLNCRLANRFNKLNKPIYYHRGCMCNKEHPHHSDQCKNEFETSYSPERPEIVYCEECYQQEVV